MDPDANLKRQIEIARAIRTTFDGDEQTQAELGVELADLVVELNNWLSVRGFLPKAWTR